MVFEFFIKYTLSKRAGAIIRRIAWITIIGLCVSISALITVMSVMNALNKNTQRRTLAVEPHFSIDFSANKRIEILENHSSVDFLKKKNGNLVLLSENQEFVLRTIEGSFKSAKAKGYTQNDLNILLNKIHRANASKRSNALNTENFTENLSPNEIIIGSDLAISMGLFEGDTVLAIPPEELLLPPGETPKYERVTVKKIITTNIPDIDAQAVYYIQGKSFARFADSASLRAQAEVWLNDLNDVDKMKRQLEKNSDLKVFTWKEKNSSLFLALRLEKAVIALFLSLAALISAFSLMTLVVLLISQKVREIGLLQTIGMSQNSTRNLFMRIGFLLGAIGLSSGIIVGSGISVYLEYFPLNILPDVYIDSQIPAELNIGMLFIIATSGIILLYLGSLLSSKPVLELTPSESLRFKN